MIEYMYMQYCCLIDADINLCVYSLGSNVGVGDGSARHSDRSVSRVVGPSEDSQTKLLLPGYEGSWRSTIHLQTGQELAFVVRSIWRMIVQREGPCDGHVKVKCRIWVCYSQKNSQEAVFDCLHLY